MSRLFLVASSVVLVLLLLSCATPLLNSNMLDVASTVDDLATRQVVFNLVRVKENQFALPSQVQIQSGQVAAGSSVTPSISTPLNSSIVTAINRSTTPALNSTWTYPNISTNVAGTASNTDSWNIQLVQDPEQLRRLRLLYQYGAHEIEARDVLCEYPVPQLPQQSENAAKGKQAQAPKRRYIRTRYTISLTIPSLKDTRMVRAKFDSGSGLSQTCPWGGYGKNFAVMIGENPDPAFLNFPNCVLCATRDVYFNALMHKYRPRLKAPYSASYMDFDPAYEYVPTFLNPGLLPNASLNDVETPNRLDRKIDWLSVVRDGVDFVPDDARRIGGSGGYTVYVHPSAVTGWARNGSDHFSEFVLAIIDATQQPAELQKRGPTAPPLVQPTGASSTGGR